MSSEGQPCDNPRSCLRGRSASSRLSGATVRGLLQGCPAAYSGCTPLSCRCSDARLRASGKVGADPGSERHAADGTGRLLFTSEPCLAAGAAAVPRSWCELLACRQRRILLRRRVRRRCRFKPFDEWSAFLHAPLLLPFTLRSVCRLVLAAARRAGVRQYFAEQASSLRRRPRVRGRPAARRRLPGRGVGINLPKVSAVLASGSSRAAAASFMSWVSR